MNLTQIFKNLFLRKTNNLKDVIDPYWCNEKFDNDIILKTDWFLCDSEIEYDLYGKEDSKYNKTDIVYEIDSAGFRQSSYDKTSNKNLIACFGCSNTFGIGLPWKDIWVSQLQKLIGMDYQVKNYGISGSSNDCIARLVYNYLNQYTPKYICCFFPSIGRREIAMENFGLLNFLNFDWEFEELKKENYDTKELEELKSIYDAYQTINKEKDNIYNFIKNLRFIKSLCKNKNVTFLWTTWDMSILSFDKDFLIQNIDEDGFVGLSLEDITKADKARDGHHFGFNFNKKLANLFYEKINK